MNIRIIKIFLIFSFFGVTIKSAFSDLFVFSPLQFMFSSPLFRYSSGTSIPSSSYSTSNALPSVLIVSLICVTEVPAARVCVASGVNVSLEGDKMTLLTSWILILLLLSNYLSLPGLVEV